MLGVLTTVSRITLLISGVIEFQTRDKATRNLHELESAARLLARISEHPSATKLGVMALG